MKIMEDHEIGPLWKGDGLVGNERRGYQRTDPQANRGEQLFRSGLRLRYKRSAFRKRSTRSSKILDAIWMRLALQKGS